LSTLAG
jgi:hypothetical protein